MKRLALEKRVQIINLLVEGNSMRATARISNVDINTVTKLLYQIGSFCLWYHKTNVKNVSPVRVQCDEIWSFVYSKQKNTPQDLRGKGIAGDIWTWVALDPDSKLVISWYVGNRELQDAIAFMEDLKSRILTRVQMTTDRLIVYPEAIQEVFHGKIDYAQLIKEYIKDPTKGKKHTTPYVVKTGKSIVIGHPDPDYISTSLVERQNLTMRMSMRRYTRLTNGFSKKLLNHKYMVGIYYVYYNFCRIHSSIRVTPAMEAGLTKDILEIEDIIKLADE